MHKTTITTKQHAPSSSNADVRSVEVSIPRPPWGDIVASDRRETAPRNRMIRADGFRLKDDPIIRHAMRVG